MNKRTFFAFLALIAAVSFGCGEDDDGQTPTPSDVVVTIEAAGSVQGVGLTNTFVAKVTGATDTSVTWSVNSGKKGRNPESCRSLPTTARSQHSGLSLRRT